MYINIDRKCTKYYTFVEGNIMCYVTSTELKNNLSHYLELSEKEDVFVTKNNRVISVMSNPKQKAFENFFALREEFIKDSKEDNIDYDKLLKEAIMKKCGF